MGLEMGLIGNEREFGGSFLAGLGIFGIVYDTSERE